MNNSTQQFLRPFYTIILTALLVNAAQAQCSQTGVISPSSAINDDGSGAWGFTTPGYAVFGGQSFATASATLTLLGGNTDNLKIQGFGLNIPAGATICGIQMKMSKRASGISILASVSDYRVRLMKNGSMNGSNRAKGANWTGTSTTSTYGGPTDLWGSTWTAADVNSGNFGVSVSAEINGLLSLLPSAHINDVSMTVYFSQITLPIKLVSFNGQLSTTKDVKLTWTTSGEEENTNFTVQRSNDGSTWSNVETIAADATGRTTNYSYTDKNSLRGKTYFRLSIRNSTGATTYSDIVTVMDRANLSLSVFPNPAAESATIRSDAKISSIRLFNAMGTAQQVPVTKISDNSSRINTSALPVGLYYVDVDGEMIKLLKK
ncbi:MAG: T9SS type A sorting domain-containing protein [Chitinophagaceae bacterium]|nr:MAG: T9SS type A sorting domain-containing protein [Chitinophagaceae bacterium]